MPKFRVFIVEFIVGNTVEFVNVTMNMTMNPTNSDKVSENEKKKSYGACWELNPGPLNIEENMLTITPRKTFLFNNSKILALKCQE